MRRSIFVSLAILGCLQMGMVAGQEPGTPDTRLSDTAFLKARDEALAGAKCPDRKDPVATATPSPRYPDELKGERVRGSATTEGIILRDGSVAFGRVLKASRPEFGGAALEALKQYRYKPGTCNGQPVPRFVTIIQTFTLQ